MTPPDQNDEQPSALSRLERALAGFGEPRAEEPVAAPEAEDAPEQEAEDAVDEAEETAPVSPFETDAELENWEPSASVTSSPALDIAGAVEAVERLTAAQRDDSESVDSLLERPVSDADEYVLAATAAGTEVEDEPDAPDAPEDLRARVREIGDEAVEDEDRRAGVDEGSDLEEAPDEKYVPAELVEEAVEELPPPRVTDAAASWSRDQGDAQLPYFLVEDDVPVAAEPVPTLEELRQTLPEEKHTASVARTLAEIPILLLVAALIAFLVKTFLAQAYYIPSGSMLPQLRIDDRVVVSKLAYKLHDPRRGDIVVFDDPTNSDAGDDDASLLHKIGEGIGIVQPSTDEFIKRVIALPGETVEGRDGHVYVNGKRLIEPYLTADVVTTPFDKVEVRPGRVWVMGDNRVGSADSRVFGQIEIDSIVGRAMVTVWPFGHAEFL